MDLFDVLAIAVVAIGAISVLAFVALAIMDWRG